MQEIGVVPVFYHPDFEVMKRIMHACYDGGARIFELTNRGDYAHELFAALNKYAEKTLPDLILGVGTVMDAVTAALYIQSGANFVVAPCIHEDTGRACHRRKVLWIPGGATATEISRAEELGAELVKISPGEVLTPAFVRWLKGPMPWSRVMVTGGVEPTEESLRQWFEAGATCVGLGSQLIGKQIIAKNRWAELSETVRKTIRVAASFR